MCVGTEVGVYGRLCSGNPGGLWVVYGCRDTSSLCGLSLWLRPFFFFFFFLTAKYRCSSAACSICSNLEELNSFPGQVNSCP